MTTEELIGVIRDKHHYEQNCALRHALAYRLYKTGLFTSVEMGKLLDCTKQMVYIHIYTIRDRMGFGDAISVDAMKELEAHELTVDKKAKDCGGYVYTVRIDEVEFASIERAL